MSQIEKMVATITLGCSLEGKLQGKELELIHLFRVTASTRYSCFVGEERNQRHERPDLTAC